MIPAQKRCIRGHQNGSVDDRRRGNEAVGGAAMQILKFGRQNCNRAGQRQFRHASEMISPMISTPFQMPRAFFAFG